MMTPMKFRHELTYDSPPADVFAMLADPAFREKVSVAQDVVSADITLTPNGEGFDFVNDQVQKTAGLPTIAKKITGETTRAIVTEKWGDARGGSVDVSAPGKPTSVQGTVALLESGTGTNEVIELEIKVKVPLIGGKLESLLGDEIKANLEIEQTVGAAWLAGEH